MVLFEVDGHRIAIPVGTIREIIPARPCTPLPGSAPYVLGLVNLRGRLVTVIDLGLRLRLRAASNLPEHSIVVVEHAGKTVGIAVEELAGMVEVFPEALATSAETIRSLGIDRSYLRGIGESDGELFLAVDTDEILRPLLS
ncbi:MAG: chemotaxis protein CheW [Gemmatimonadota bacterium]|jgi:purine-binding chemotaxis protein CheW|nr:chemotaxis protein CheW [Gemmatimonadota bacterium]